MNRVATTLNRIRGGIMAGVCGVAGIDQLAGDDLAGLVLLGAAVYVTALELDRRGLYRAGYRRGLITAADAAAELYAGRRRIGDLGIPASADVDPDDGWRAPYVAPLNGRPR